MNESLSESQLEQRTKEAKQGLALAYDTYQTAGDERQAGAAIPLIIDACRDLLAIVHQQHLEIRWLNESALVERQPTTAERLVALIEEVVTKKVAELLEV